MHCSNVKQLDRHLVVGEARTRASFGEQIFKSDALSIRPLGKKDFLKKITIFEETQFYKAILFIMWFANQPQTEMIDY